MWAARIRQATNTGQRDTAIAEPAQSRRSRPRAPLILALAALLLLGAAVAWRPLLHALLGPPDVTMVEVYGQPRDGGGPGAVFDHAGLTGLLSRHVDSQGRVDYRALGLERDLLDAYLARLATASFESLSRDEKLAFLINAYNAFTLALVLDHYPIESIRDIPAGRRWVGRTFELAGESLSLDELEHERIRPRFREPRVHFALVCASIGCPPLRAEAYEGRRLEEQLEEQTRLAHSDPRWFTIDSDGVGLTRLYDWFRTDFEQVHGSILAFASRYSTALAARLEQKDDLEVRFLDYDWSLNDRRR